MFKTKRLEGKDNDRFNNDVYRMWKNPNNEAN